jgi:tellurite resistance protein
MTNRIFLSALCAACVVLAAAAQQHDPATPRRGRQSGTAR